MDTGAVTTKGAKKGEKRFFSFFCFGDGAAGARHGLSYVPRKIVFAISHETDVNSGHFRTHLHPLNHTSLKPQAMAKEKKEKSAKKEKRKEPEPEAEPVAEVEAPVAKKVKKEKKEKKSKKDKEPVVEVRVSRAHTPAPSFKAHVRRTKSYLRLWGHDAVLCYAPHGAMLGESRGEGFGFFAPPPRAAAATGCSKSNDTPALVVVAPVGARDAQQPRARLRLRGVQFHGLTPSAPPVVPQPLFPVSFRCDIALMVLASPNSPPRTEGGGG